MGFKVRLTRSEARCSGRQMCWHREPQQSRSWGLTRAHARSRADPCLPGPLGSAGTAPQAALPSGSPLQPCFLPEDRRPVACAPSPPNASPPRPPTAAAALWVWPHGASDGQAGLEAAAGAPPTHYGLFSRAFGPSAEQSDLGRAERGQNPCPPPPAPCCALGSLGEAGGPALGASSLWEVLGPSLVVPEGLSRWRVSERKWALWVRLSRGGKVWALTCES